MTLKKTNEVEILEHAGEGYLRLVDNAKWTVAGLNGAPRFDAGGLSLTTGRQEAK